MGADPSKSVETVLTLQFKDWLEIGSDFLGAISSLAILVPVYRVTAARAALRKVAERARQADPDDITGATSDAESVDAQLAEFNPRDAIWLRAGLGALFVSFVLRLGYHWLSKAAELGG